MEFLQPIRWIAAGAGAVALMSAGPVAAWADQSNDNHTSTAAAGAPVAAPVTGAVQLNLACPANLNVLGSQRDAGACAPGAQANGNSSTTSVAGGDQVLGLVAGPLVAPVTAALQLNVNCPVNVNVVSEQRRSGSCVPGPQSNSNTAATHVSGPATGLVGGPLVAPITTGAGLNVTCPTNVNVLSTQDSSGDCIGGDTSSSSSCGTGSQCVVEDSLPPTVAAPPDAADSAPSQTDSAQSQTTPDGGPVASAGFSELPGPPVAGALSVGRAPARLPALGLLVLAVLAVAAMAVRRLKQQR